jgi:outer membrane immunogenic protein
MKIIIAAASAAAALCAVSGVAQAQTAPVGVYGGIGYASTNPNKGDANLGAIQARLGYRFMPWVGVEGELAVGVNDDSAGAFNVKEKHSEAIYGVGFLPISPNADLLARVGYGTTKFKFTDGPVPDFSTNEDSWNFGVGGQYHFDGKNGVRVDYTREEFTKDSAGHADVYSIAYTRRF